MNYVDFCGFSLKTMEDYIGERGSVELITIPKNNGIYLDGIVVKLHNNKVSPTLYIEPLYKMYKNGDNIDGIMKQMIECFEVNSSREFNMDFFCDFNQVKEKIVFKLINKDMNASLLEEIPYREWNDLAVVYIYMHKIEDGGSASIMIRKEHIDMWKVSEEELFQNAYINSQTLLPTELKTMGAIMREMMGENYDHIKDDLGIAELDISDNMYVLSNTNRTFGAACLIYSDCIKALSCKYDCGIYIIPSSIHEVILVPANECCDKGYMKQMIYEVNMNEVDVQERLSNNLYYYDKETACISAVRGE